MYFSSFHPMLFDSMLINCIAYLRMRFSSQLQENCSKIFQRIDLETRRPPKKWQMTKANRKLPNVARRAQWIGERAWIKERVLIRVSRGMLGGHTSICGQGSFPSAMLLENQPCAESKHWNIFHLAAYKCSLQRKSHHCSIHHSFEVIDEAAISCWANDV